MPEVEACGYPQHPAHWSWRPQVSFSRSARLRGAGNGWVWRGHSFNRLRTAKYWARQFKVLWTLTIRCPWGYPRGSLEDCRLLALCKRLGWRGPRTLRSAQRRPRQIQVTCDMNRSRVTNTDFGPREAPEALLNRGFSATHLVEASRGWGTNCCINTSTGGRGKGKRVWIS